MFKRKRPKEETPKEETAQSQPHAQDALLQTLLGVHSAPTLSWLADAAATAAERGLGALHCLLFLAEPSGVLAGQRPASSERMRSLAKVHQALDTDLTTFRFDLQSCPATALSLQQGKASSLTGLGQAIPLAMEGGQLEKAESQLGIAEVWLVPLHCNGASAGLLVLLMPSNGPADIAEAEVLGRHVAVAQTNLQEKEAGRKRGEVDAVRWVYDERRFLDQLGTEIRRAQRHKRPLSLTLLRLLNLEELRERYGRFLADQVLRHMGSQLAETMRDTDFLGAFREDGFAAILVEADLAGAERAKERVLDGLDALSLPEAEELGLDLRLACATATLLGDGETAEDLIASAEARLDQESTGREEVA